MFMNLCINFSKNWVLSRCRKIYSRPEYLNEYLPLDVMQTQFQSLASIHTHVGLINNSRVTLLYQIIYCD